MCNMTDKLFLNTSMDKGFSKLTILEDDKTIVTCGNVLFGIVHNIIENILTKNKNI